MRSLPIVSEDDPHEVVVRGGARGLTVEYRELQATAGELDLITERLEGIRDRGVGVCFKLYGLNGASALPAAAGTAADAVNDAVLSLRRNIEDLEEAAESLRKAAENYLEVEGRLETKIKALPGGGSVALAFALWKLGGWGYPDRVVSELAVPDVDGVLKRVVPGFEYGVLGPVDVSRQAGHHEAVQLAGTAGGLLERSRLLMEEEAAVIEVLSVVRGGQRLRIVTLPGMQNEPKLGDSNPFDIYGNVEGRTGDSRYVAEAVAEALRQAGAAPGESVILTGYSQGGMHAINIGARLARDGEFNIEMILTAGAPGGDLDLPEGVKAMHLEHAEDWITGVDGASNADTPDRITVTGTAPVTDEGSGGLGPAHQLDVYLDLAAQADASSDPSLKESLGNLAEIIGPGTVAARSLFKLSRKPAPQPPVRRPSRLPTLPPPRQGTVPPLPQPVSPLPVPVNPVAPLERWLPTGPGQ